MKAIAATGIAADDRAGWGLAHSSWRVNLEATVKSNIALAALLAFGASSIASATTFVVNKTSDDESAHTLRWAIEQNNLNPRGIRYQAQFPASAHHRPGHDRGKQPRWKHCNRTAGHRCCHRWLKFHQWRRCLILPWREPKSKRAECPFIHQARVLGGRFKQCGN